MNNQDLFPLSDETTSLILMHREIHFGGKFSFMIDYYEKGGKGMQEEFSIDAIRQLQKWEEEMQQNLAALILSGPEAETIREARAIYQSLSDLYENETESNRLPRLIADLILSEEEEPESEIEAIVREKADIVPSLIQIIRSEELYDPLYPGYGEAPHLAIKCLQQMGDQRALRSLFELIGRKDVQEEETILQALRAIGPPAKEFLLKILKSTPLTQDNERAAIALIHFREDPAVGAACLQLLLDPAIRKISPLSTYLALACEGLESKEERQQFRSLLEDPHTPSILQIDLKQIARQWKN